MATIASPPNPIATIGSVIKDINWIILGPPLISGIYPLSIYISYHIVRNLQTKISKKYRPIYGKNRIGSSRDRAKTGDRIGDKKPGIGDIWRLFGDRYRGSIRTTGISENRDIGRFWGYSGTGVSGDRSGFLLYTGISGPGIDPGYISRGYRGYIYKRLYSISQEQSISRSLGIVGRPRSPNHQP